MAGGADDEPAGVDASMKGFPRRGSDFWRDLEDAFRSAAPQ